MPARRESVWNGSPLPETPYVHRFERRTCFEWLGALRQQAGLPWWASAVVFHAELYGKTIAWTVRSAAKYAVAANAVVAQAAVNATSADRAAWWTHVVTLPPRNMTWMDDLAHAGSLRETLKVWCDAQAHSSASVARELWRAPLGQAIAALPAALLGTVSAGVVALHQLAQTGLELVIAAPLSLVAHTLAPWLLPDVHAVAHLSLSYWDSPWRIFLDVLLAYGVLGATSRVLQMLAWWLITRWLRVITAITGTYSTLLPEQDRIIVLAREASADSKAGDQRSQAAAARKFSPPAEVTPTAVPVLINLPPLPACPSSGAEQIAHGGSRIGAHASAPWTEEELARGVAHALATDARDARWVVAESMGFPFLRAPERGRSPLVLALPKLTYRSLLAAKWWITPREPGTPQAGHDIITALRQRAQFVLAVEDGARALNYIVQDQESADVNGGLLPVGLPGGGALPVMRRARRQRDARRAERAAAQDGEASDEYVEVDSDSEAMRAAEAAPVVRFLSSEDAAQVPGLSAASSVLAAQSMREIVVAAERVFVGQAMDLELQTTAVVPPPEAEPALRAALGVDESAPLPPLQSCSLHARKPTGGILRRAWRWLRPARTAVGVFIVALASIAAAWILGTLGVRWSLFVGRMLLGFAWLPAAWRHDVHAVLLGLLVTLTWVEDAMHVVGAGLNIGASVMRHIPWKQIESTSGLRGLLRRWLYVPVIGAGILCWRSMIHVCLAFSYNFYVPLHMSVRRASMFLLYIVEVQVWIPALLGLCAVALWDPQGAFVMPVLGNRVLRGLVCTSDADPAVLSIVTEYLGASAMRRFCPSGGGAGGIGTALHDGLSGLLSWVWSMNWQLALAVWLLGYLLWCGVMELAQFGYVPGLSAQQVAAVPWHMLRVKPMKLRARLSKPMRLAAATALGLLLTWRSMVYFTSAYTLAPGAPGVLPEQAPVDYAVALAQLTGEYCPPGIATMLAPRVLPWLQLSQVLAPHGELTAGQEELVGQLRVNAWYFVPSLVVALLCLAVSVLVLQLPSLLQLCKRVHDQLYEARYRRARVLIDRDIGQ